MNSPSPARIRSRVLLVESDPWDAGLVQEALDELEEQQYRKLLPWQMELYHAETLAEALAALEQEAFDIILLNLDLTDSQALHTFLRVHPMSRTAPIVILCNAREEYTALAAVREGAFSYLLKEDLDCLPLARTLRSAMERQQAIVARAELPLLDELTSLISRDGFVLLGEQSLQLAARWQRPATLFLIELTGYSMLEDAYGHQAHDLALIETGDLLRSVFRESDVVARLQGDTFGALCFDDPAELESMEDRIHRYLRSLAPHPSHRPALSYLSGQSTLIPTASTNLDVMLQRAEAHLAMNRGQELAPALG
jgi:two-component system, cell cycle response regulator